MIDSSNIIVTIRDARQFGDCCAGSRIFAKKHGLDFKKFVHEGLPLELIEATGDAMAIEFGRKVRNVRQK